MRKQFSWWSVISVFIVFFDIIFFLLVETVSDVQWVSVIFLHIAYFILILFSVFLRNRKNDVVLGYPVIYLSLKYFWATFILSLIIVIFEFGFLTVKITFVLHFLMLGIYFFMLFSNLLMNEKTNHQREIETRNISFIKENVATLEQFKLTVQEQGERHKIEEVIELLRYGQIISNYETIQIENSITEQINNLGRDTGKLLTDQLKEIENLIRQREIMIKSMVTN